MFDEIYKQLPTNVRLYLEFLAGKDTPITEKDFTADELQYMVNQLQSRDSEPTFDELFDESRAVPVNAYYSEAVYNPENIGRFLETLQTPEYRVQTSLGEYTGFKDEEGNFTKITDAYDFNAEDLPEILSVLRNQKYVDTVNEGDYEISMLDVLSALDTPQLAAELFARYVRPDHSREVDISLPQELVSLNRTGLENEFDE